MADDRTPEIKSATDVTSAPPTPPVSSPSAVVAATGAILLPSTSSVSVPTSPLSPNLQSLPSLTHRGSLSFRLPRNPSSQRIENILEGARERAESISRNNSGDFSPKLQTPLLSHSPRNHGLGMLAEGGSEEVEGGSGIIRTQPSRQHPLDYQSTVTHTSHSPRRRAVESRRPSDQDQSFQIGQTGGGGGDGDRRQTRQERDNNNNGSGTWKKRLQYFQSIELENKGSVARDHLALERTFLAWLRTSLAFASIGIAITQLFRLNTSLADDASKTDGTLRHLGKPLGSTFLAISILILFLGYKRYLQAQHWVIRGKFPASRGTIMLVAFIAFAVTVASLIVVVAVQSGS